jgi:hypothetical protein
VGLAATAAAKPMVLLFSAKTSSTATLQEPARQCQHSSLLATSHTVLLIITEHPNRARRQSSLAASEPVLLVLEEHLLDYGILLPIPQHCYLQGRLLQCQLSADELYLLLAPQCCWSSRETSPVLSDYLTLYSWISLPCCGREESSN